LLLAVAYHKSIVSDSKSHFHEDRLYSFYVIAYKQKEESGGVSIKKMELSEIWDVSPQQKGYKIIKQFAFFFFEGL
jgi:hypothetical protein